MRRDYRTANDYKQRLAFPSVFPDTFRYVPVSFVEDDTILGPDMLAIGDASHYEFGILSSDAHMAWLKAVAGSADGRFTYTVNRVYNNFVWPDKDKLTDELRAAVENAARLIEAARDAHPEFTFGRCYPTDAMPPDIAEAHRINDRAVRAAYGLSPDATECEVMSFLMNRYSELAEAAKSEGVVRDRERPGSRWRH